jgi:hypothetical protein
MTNEDLRAALADLPPEAPVFAESCLDYIWIECVEINEDGDIVLSASGGWK